MPLTHRFFRFILALAVWIPITASSQTLSQVVFDIKLDQPNQTFLVEMKSGGGGDSVTLIMPAWTPGYYQLLHFADQVSGFKVMSDGKEIPFRKTGRNGWQFASGRHKSFTVTYSVKTSRSFVATPYLDQDRGYLVPTGVLMHPAGTIDSPIKISIQLPDAWTVATGLDAVEETNNQFITSSFDILYDSPLLMGKLEELPSFEVKGIPHRFIGYKLGEFDRVTFMKDLKKLVETSVAIIGDIPYKQYTFIAIGPGQGGIEHLNSTTFAFSGDAMKTDEGRKRMYAFLAHEYFHHYNVKRIRPFELGPFDYNKENRTNMLWVAEGFTVYYDEMIVRRSGLSTTEDLLAKIQGRLLGYENKPGRLYQSATQASYNTWSDGPFGRTDDEVNKTVSVYDKGAILGLMLDFEIRHLTKNKKSLNDVMRALYNQFYLNQNRGFKEEEFQKICEQIAGSKLTELFEYASTVKPIDYKKYFAYGGLDIDIEPKVVTGGWLGISGRSRGDTVIVSRVEYESPAWKNGIRSGTKILKVNGQPAATFKAEPMIIRQNPGEKMILTVQQNSSTKEIDIELGKKIEPDFRITLLPKPTALQKQIQESWLSGR